MTLPFGKTQKLVEVLLVSLGVFGLIGKKPKSPLS